MLSEKTVSLVLALDDSEFNARMGKARERLEQLASASNFTAQSFSISSGILSAFGGVVSGLAVGTVARELVEAGMAAERMRNAMSSATGSLSQGAVEMQFVRAEAQRLGLDLEKAASDYAHLTASAQGSSLQGAETRRIFSAVSEASIALGLSAEETSGALRAIQQMISKGTVASEELRGQLGERLPGAFNVAARAMGVTTAELGKMLEQGKVVSSDFLPRFADELPRAFKASADTLNSSQAAVNRLNTALFELKVEVMDRGGKDVFIALTEGATSLAESLRDVNREYGSFDEVIEAQTGKLTRFAAAYLIFQQRVLSGEFGKIPDDWRNFFEAEKEARANAASKGAPMGSEEHLANLVAAGKRAGGLLTPQDKGATGEAKRPSWATPPTNKTFFSEAWDRAADELAYEEAQRFVLNVNELGQGFPGFAPGGLPQQLMGPVDLLSREGRTEMTGAEQAQFDTAASLAEWEALRAASRERELLAEQQFYADRALLNGSSTEMELLRIQEDEQRWIESWAMRSDTVAQYQERMSQIEAMSAAKRAQIARQEGQLKFQAANNYANAFVNLTNALFTFSSGKSKELFYINKAAGIANAIVSTYAGAANALDDLPYPFNLAAAASVVAAGMAQVAQISATDFTGGGASGGGGLSAPAGGFGEGTPTSPVITQPVSPYPQASQGPQEITIKVVGVITDAVVEDTLIPMINNAASRNVRIEFTR